jgi:DNA-binding CsgD family transcriptional regulator
VYAVRPRENPSILSGMEGRGRSKWATEGELLDRERELDLLVEAVGAICSGEGSLTVLEGAAGIGKSRLVQAAGLAAAEAGATVLAARCEELESALPWSLARSLLTPALERVGPARRRSALEHAGGAAAEVLVGAPGSRPEKLERAGLLRRAHALTWLVSDLAAEAPLVMLVDDLHWADEPSLHFIAYLAARAPELPVMLVLSRRPRTAGSRAETLERAAGHPQANTLELGPLGAAAVEQLVSGALGGLDDPDLLAACRQVTGGNPFYLHELLRELSRVREAGRKVDASVARAATPNRVVSNVCQRIDRLGPDARDLASAVAVLGGGASLHHAARLAALEPADAAAALDALAGAEILLARDSIDFVHPLVAAAVYEDLGAARRGELHLLAARLLAADRIELARVGVHLLAGARHGDPWVVATLREAAAGAVANGAGELAIEYLERALLEPPASVERAAVLGELGHAEALLGRTTAGEHLRRAVDLAADAGERAGLLLELGRALALAGDHGQAARIFEEGIHALEQADRELAVDSELAHELQAALWMSRTLIAARSGAAIPTVHELTDLDGELTGGQRQLLAALAQQQAMFGDSPSRLRALAERAWGAGELLRSEGADGRAWTLATGTLMIADELELELELCNAAIDDARAQGSPMAYATASYCRAWPLLQRGQVDYAAADAQSALAARADGWGAFVGAAASIFALACLERGAIDEAQRALEPTLADPAMRQSSEYLLLMWAQARLLLAGERPAEALDLLLQIGGLAAEVGFDRPVVLPWRPYAAFAAKLTGEHARAGALAEEGLASARESEIGRVIAEALRLRARVSPAKQALAQLEQARALIPGAPPRLEWAHVLVEYGAALRRLQRRSEACEALQEGLRLARAGGARTLAGLAAVELRAAGISRSPAEVDGAEALTPSERRVAALAARGHPNREIAQLLFVTVKAVEYHLGNAYRKLGIRRRSQLARALDGPDAPAPAAAALEV